MTRTRLPNRRPSVVLDFYFDGQHYHGSYSPYLDGRPAEVFLNAARVGSPMQAIAKGYATVASLALQHGCPLDVIRKALPKNDDGSPSEPMGMFLDMVAGDIAET